MRMKYMPSKRAMLWAVLLLIGIASSIYGFMAFSTLHYRGVVYLRANPRLGATLPVPSEQCKATLKATSLNPHGAWRPPEFREYGNIWLLDPAKTIMYDAAILSYPECLQVMVSHTALTETRRILVIYDRQRGTELLVVRNYK